MTQQAGDIEQGLLWKQEHLSPLPIPTGEQPADLLNLIWRKNEVYLDLGTFPMAAGWMVLHSGTVFFLVLSLWTGIDFYNASYEVPWWAHAMYPFGGLLLMGPLWYGYIRQWRKPLNPPIRFNRQRREVCLSLRDGDSWFVPWERVHAIAPSVTNLGTHGAMRHGALILWFPLKGEEYEPYHGNKEGQVLMVSPGGGPSSMAQWECIRTFMEVGPEAVPEPSVIPHRDLTLWQSSLEDLREAAAKRGWALALLWEGFFGEVVFNLTTYQYFARKKLAVLPDLTAPEVLEWSKPLPREQWAKRSPKLEAAIAEREAELAASTEAASEEVPAKAALEHEQLAAHHHQ